MKPHEQNVVWFVDRYRRYREAGGSRTATCLDYQLKEEEQEHSK